MIHYSIISISHYFYIVVRIMNSLIGSKIERSERIYWYLHDEFLFLHVEVDVHDAWQPNVD